MTGSEITKCFLAQQTYSLVTHEAEVFLGGEQIGDSSELQRVEDVRLFGKRYLTGGQ